MKEYIESITMPRVWAAMLVFLALVGPVYLALFHYKPDLILSLDLPKLILLCVSVSLPFLAANAVLLFFFLPGLSERTTLDRATQVMLWILSALLTVSVFYTVLLESFLQSRDFEAFLHHICYRQLALALALIAIFQLNKRMKKNRANKRPEGTEGKCPPPEHSQPPSVPHT